MALSTLAAPSGCSYMQGLLTLNGERLPFIHYRELDEIWMPGKPVMKTTGETTITQSVEAADAAAGGPTSASERSEAGPLLHNLNPHLVVLLWLCPDPLSGCSIRRCLIPFGCLG
jgi:hypothetical protein